MDEQLFAVIREMIMNEVGVEEEMVVPGAHLQDDLGADSLALLNLAEAISSRYGVDVLSDDMVDVESVEKLVCLVESKLSEKGPQRGEG